MSDKSNNVADDVVGDSASDAPERERSAAEMAEKEDLAEEKELAVDAPLGSVAAGPVDEEVAADPAAGEAVVGGDSEEEEVVVQEDGAARESQEVEEDPATKKSWYILKVQSNRERSIATALRRKIAIEGLEEYFGDVIVPTEKVTEFKGGKKKVVERKLYPGYIVVSMCINDDTWFAVRETSGIGDFTGSGGKPTPMLDHEVARIVHEEEKEHDESPKLDIRFKIKDRVKIKEGTFEGFEGDVQEIDEASGRVTVMINIFSRSTPVELEYWQIESV